MHANFEEVRPGRAGVHASSPRRPPAAAGDSFAARPQPAGHTNDRPADARTRGRTDIGTNQVCGGAVLVDVRSKLGLLICIADLLPIERDTIRRLIDKGWAQALQKYSAVTWIPAHGHL